MKLSVVVSSGVGKILIDGHLQPEMHNGVQFSDGRVCLRKGKKKGELWVFEYFEGISTEATRSISIKATGRYQLSQSWELLWEHENLEILHGIMSVFNLASSSLFYAKNPPEAKTTKGCTVESRQTGKGQNSIQIHYKNKDSRKHIHAVVVGNDVRADDFAKALSHFVSGIECGLEFFEAWLTKGEEGVKLARKCLEDLVYLSLPVAGDSFLDPEVYLQIRDTKRSYSGKLQPSKTDNQSYAYLVLLLCKKHGWRNVLTGLVHSDDQGTIAEHVPQIDFFEGLNDIQCAVDYLVRRYNVFAIERFGSERCFEFVDTISYENGGSKHQLTSTVGFCTLPLYDKTEGALCDLLYPYKFNEMEEALLQRIPYGQALIVPGIWEAQHAIEARDGFVCGQKKEGSKPACLFRHVEACEIGVDQIASAAICLTCADVKLGSKASFCAFLMDGGRAHVYGTKKKAILHLPQGKRAVYLAVIYDLDNHYQVWIFEVKNEGGKAIVSSATLERVRRYSIEVECEKVCRGESFLVTYC